MPSVSLCVPAYNGSEHLGEALSSALRQTFPDYELLVVDDASTDRTVEVAGSFTDARIRVHRNAARLGIPGNWNECLRQARGEYVKFLFQDDTLLPDCLEKLVAALEKTPDAPMAFGRRDVVVESGTDVLGRAYATALAAFQASAGTTIRGCDLVETALRQGRDLTLNVVGEPSFVLLRREVVLRAGGFDPAFTQLSDWELWLRLAHGNALAVVDEPVGRFRIHARSQSAASYRTLEVRREMLRLLERIRSLYGAELSDQARRALRRAYWKHRLRLAAAILTSAPTASPSSGPSS